MLGIDRRDGFCLFQIRRKMLEISSFMTCANFWKQIEWYMRDYRLSKRNRFPAKNQTLWSHQNTYFASVLWVFFKHAPGSPE